MLVDDLTRRALEHAGYHVKHVVSITDLDDNTLAAAEASGEPLAELCRRHEAEFHEDCRALGLRPASRYVRTSESVDDMVALTGELVRSGYAYEKLHSVYFNIGRVESYGELSGKDLGKIKVGATVDLERYDKDDPRDFTLLRRSNLGEIRKGLSVKTEWGNVRPSWHVQCSAMARAQLGPEFDLHMASADLVFPHNENEIAQSRALTGKSQARVWLHSELVLVGGKKIGTDPENTVTLPDLLARGFTAREVRFFFLQTHYRQPVTLADDLLDASRVSLRRIDECVRNLRAVPAAPAEAAPDDATLQTSAQEMKDEFRRALYDDLNLPAGLAAVFRLVRQANYLMSQSRLSAAAAKAVLAALGHVGSMLGLLPEPESEAETLPPEIAELLAAREAARRDKDFAAADRFRDELVAKGYLIEDRAEGTRVRRRP
jgi:cysteinyl-tRNA synthetase